MRKYVITILAGVLVVGGVVLATDIVQNFYGNTNVNLGENEAQLGAFPGPKIYQDIVINGDLTVTEDFLPTGGITTSAVTTLGAGVVYDVESITATTTLTSASGNLILFPTSANMITVTLPASTTAGAMYTFVVTGALTGSSVVIASAEGSNIEGILMVNDADVVCSNEDVLTIVTDGEVVGDRVQLMSDGTSWIILDSDIDAAGKMTCTT